MFEIYKAAFKCAGKLMIINFGACSKIFAGVGQDREDNDNKIEMLLVFLMYLSKCPSVHVIALDTDWTPH